MRKICPLNPNKTRPDHTYCLGDGCAWWNDVSEQCAILTLAQGLVYLFGEVAEKEADNDAVASVEDKS